MAPKTVNRYREILCRLISWAIKQQLVRMPGKANPASQVERYKERAGAIRFLSLPQVDEQLHVLRFTPQLQTMVAVLIYAGLRREELLWLTLDDLDFSRRGGGHGLLRIRDKSIAYPDGPRSWQPKTRVNRAVPISRALRDQLDSYISPATVTPATSDHFPGWLFPSPEGTRWDSDNFSGLHLRPCNADAGLPGCRAAVDLS